jgi:hypothetical protein
MELLSGLACIIALLAIFPVARFLWIETWYPGIRDIALEVMFKESHTEVHDGVSIWDAANGRLAHFVSMNRYLKRMEMDELIERVAEDEPTLGIPHDHCVLPAYRLTEKGRIAALSLINPPP